MAESRDDPRPGGGGGGGGGGSTIPTTPRRHRHTRTGHTGGGSTTGGSTTTGGSSGSGSHAKDPYAAAQAHADAQRAEDERKARNKNIHLAETVQQQIDALKKELGKKGLIKGLRQQLANVRLTTAQTDAVLMRGYRESVGSLRNTESDNQKAGEQGSNLNLQNRSRERSNAMSEVAAQGAGESDLLRAQGASLRNWQANQSDVNRSFYDTLTSVNSSLTELTNDQRTARFQVYNQANADRNTLWTDYYTDRGDVLTQLGNAYGLQSQYYGLANEADPSKHLRKLMRKTSNKSGDMFDRSAGTTGKSWENPGVPVTIRKWEGASDIEGSLNNDYRGNTLTEIAPKKPSGATLRTWRT